jgi:hypothetical protein
MNLLDARRQRLSPPLLLIYCSVVAALIEFASETPLTYANFISLPLFP